MENYVSAQLGQLGAAVALGAAGGLVYDLLRAARLIDRHDSWLTHLLDGLFAAALGAGALGRREDDDRLPAAFAVAAERRMGYSFSEEEMRDVHENTVRMVFHMTGGGTQTVIGSSIGGGQIVITSINGFDVEYTAQSNALIISQYDRKGVISNVAGILAQHDINIGVMRLSRRARGDVACTIIEVDARISAEIVACLQGLPDVISVRAINIQ